MLLIACILSGIILASTPAYRAAHISTYAELDSLILDSFTKSSLSSEQFRTYTIDLDSSLTRKVYRVNVAPSFSKTTFHVHLHQRFYDYGIQTPARIIFPERDMNIYMSYEGTILRTIRLITDESLSPSPNTKDSE